MNEKLPIDPRDFEPSQPKKIINDETIQKNPINRKKPGRKPKSLTIVPEQPPKSFRWDYLKHLIGIGKTVITVCSVLSAIFTFLWSIGWAPVTNGQLDKALEPLKIEIHQLKGGSHPS